MAENNKYEEALQAAKEQMKAQIEKTYKAGFADGAKITCATLYKTFLLGGLEKDNIIYDILRDIAKRHGCENLDEEIARMQANNETQVH